MPCHLLSLHGFVQKNEARDHLTDAASALIAIRDACVVFPPLIKSQEIAVVGDDYKLVGPRAGHVQRIGSAEEACLSRGKNVYTAAPQSLGHSFRDMLVEKEPKPTHDGGGSASPAVDRHAPY